MIKDFITTPQAMFVRLLRTEFKCGYEKISELFQQLYPQMDGSTSYDDGRTLCLMASVRIEDNFDVEPELFRELVLDRPISVIDFETTGTDVLKDRVLQFAITRINLDLSLQSFSFLVNPGMPIPPKSTEVHGITDEMVKNEPTFDKFIPNIIQTIEGTDLLTFNGLKFDIPLFKNECDRAGIEWDYLSYALIDAFQIFSHFHKRNLGAAVKTYLGEDLEGAHDAKVDTEATARVFIKQMSVHTELPLYMRDLQLMLNNGMPMADLSGKFYYNEDQQPAFKIGKHKGKTIPEVQQTDPSYFNWFLSSDFPKDSKVFLQTLLNTQQ